MKSFDKNRSTENESRQKAEKLKKILSMRIILKRTIREKRNYSIENESTFI